MPCQAEIDVALTYDLDIPKDLSFTPLATLTPMAMLALDYLRGAHDSLTLQELASEPFVLLDLRPNIAKRSPQMTVVQSLVANGFGVGLSTTRHDGNAALDGAPLVYVPREGDLRPTILGLATKQTDHRSRIVSELYRHVEARMAQSGLLGLPAVPA